MQDTSTGGESASWIDIGKQPPLQLIEQSKKPTTGSTQSFLKLNPKLNGWRKRNLIQQIRLLDFLDEFYSSHLATHAQRLILIPFGIYGSVRLTNQGAEVQEAFGSEEQRRRLRAYRVELQEFAEFLKRDYWHPKKKRPAAA